MKMAEDYYLMFKRYLVSALLALLLLPAAMLMGLDPKKAVHHYIHHTWTSKEGLPQNTISSIAQDHEGFIWIGTDNGIARFDGLEFKQYDKTNTPSLKNNSITTLYMAEDQTLWVGTYGGGITLFRNNKFHHPAWLDKLPNKLVQAIAESRDEDGKSTWIGSIGGGLIHLRGNTFSSITDENGLSSNIVYDIEVDRNQRIWCATPNGLSCLEQGSFKTYSTRDGLPSNNIKAVSQDQRGNLWIGTTAGLCVLRIQYPQGRVSRNQFFTITQEDGLSDNYVRSVREDRNGNIWVATNGGLNRLAPGTHRLLSRQSRVLDIQPFTAEDGLTDNSLLSLFEDRWGNLWMGTYGGGLNALRDGKFTFLTRRDGLAGSHIRALRETSDGALWIGTNGSGLNRQKDGNLLLYTRRDGLASNTIESLCEDGDGNLWVGTPAGLSRFNGESFRSYAPRDGLSNPSIRSLYYRTPKSAQGQEAEEPQEGELWIGTFGGGLNRFKDGQFEVFDRSKGLSDLFVPTITQDRDGDLWVGTNNGLNRFRDGTFEVFNTGDGLSSNMIMDIYPDKEGALWIATNGGGLNRFKNGRFSSFKTGMQEFDNNIIYRIIEDNRSNLWMSSNQGIFSISRAALNRYADGQREAITPYHFQENDGLRTSVCTGGFQPAGWKTAGGRVCFPTLKGIAMIDLRRITFQLDPIPPAPGAGGKDDPYRTFKAAVIKVTRDQPVVIEKVKADGQPVEEKKNARVILPAGTEKIEFHFRVLNYTAPEKLFFKYRLFGHDDNWRDSGTKSRVVYRGLSSGKYTFRVLGRNSYGDWLYRGNAYTFFIEGAFYQSFWFYFFLATLLATFSVGIPKFLAQRQRRLEEEVEKYRTSSLTIKRSSSYLTKLLDLMENEKPFLDPNLSLKSLADTLGCTKENLSQVINEHTDMNFKNFLNKYRVEEVKVKLADPKENQYVLMKIAFECGFNSKSVFNDAFKKFSGLSPSQYRKKAQEKK